MNIFKHRGIDIQFNSDGKFVAMINGKQEKSASLDAMKSKIDKQQGTVFGPIQCIRIARFREKEKADKDGLLTYIVVGTKEDKRKSYYREKYRFIADNGDNIADMIPDTKANRAALIAWRDYQEETERIEEERKTQEHDLWEKVGQVQAYDFMTKQVD